jgi:hypothetical protein
LTLIKVVLSAILIYWMKETDMLGSKPATTPIDSSYKLNIKEGEKLKDVTQYQRLVDKLIYLTVTRPDISFVVNQVSKFMQAPRKPHLDAIDRILRYLKGSPGKGIWMKNNMSNVVCGYSDADWAGSFDRKSTTDYCTFVSGNVVTWKSKKQNVVARSSAEAEYRAIASTASELIWNKQLLRELNFPIKDPMKMYCDNNAARHIASNAMFHESTKHIEIDCHFVREKVQVKEIETPYVKSHDQLAGIFMKGLIPK